MKRLLISLVVAASLTFMNTILILELLPLLLSVPLILVVLFFDPDADMGKWKYLHAILFAYFFVGSYFILTVFKFLKNEFKTRFRHGDFGG